MSTMVQTTTDLRIRIKLIVFLNYYKIPYIIVHMTWNKDNMNEAKKVIGRKKDWNKWSYEYCMQHNIRIMNDPKTSWWKFIMVNVQNSNYMVYDLDVNPKKFLPIFGDEAKTLSCRRGFPHLWRIKDKKDKKLMGSAKGNQATINNSEYPKGFFAGVDFCYDWIYENLDADITCSYDILNKKLPTATIFPLPDKFKKPRTIKLTADKPLPLAVQQNSTFFNIDDHLNAEEKEIADLVSVKYWRDYESWYRLMFGLYNHTKNVDVCDYYSKKAGDKYTNKEEIVEKLQTDLHQNIGFGKVCMYAHQSNPIEFCNIKAKYNEFDVLPDMKMAELFWSLKADDFKSIEDDFSFVYRYDQVQKIWIEYKARQAVGKLLYKTLYPIFDARQRLLNDKIKDYTQQLTDELCGDFETEEQKKEYEKEGKAQLKLLQKKLKQVNKLCEAICSASKTDAVTKCIKDLFEKEENTMDDNLPDVLCFQNIGLNIITGKKYTLQKKDFVTINTGYMWKEPTEDEMIKMKEIIETIMPNDEDRRTLLSVLYNCLKGENCNKFIVFTGGGANGKSLITELLECSLGNYFVKGHNGILTDKTVQSANPFFANLHLKRCIIYAEPDEAEPYRVANIKRLCDNNTETARQLYRTQSEIKLRGINIGECNGPPPLRGTTNDEAMKRRMAIVPFNITFVDDHRAERKDYAKGNRYYKTQEFKDKYKYAFIKYIIDTNKDDKIYISKNTENESKAYLNENDEMWNWFNSFYEKTDNKCDIVKTKDLFCAFQQSQLYGQLSNYSRRNEFNKKKIVQKLRANDIFYDCYNTGNGHKTSEHFVCFKERSEPLD